MAVWKWIDKKCHKSPNFGTNLNGHNLDLRGPTDQNSFPMARPLPGLGDGHRKWPKSPFLARVISVQCIPTKWHFWAFFYEMASLFWFSLFLFPLSGFWPFSFKPPRAALGGVIKYISVGLGLQHTGIRVGLNWDKMKIIVPWSS